MNKSSNRKLRLNIDQETVQLCQDLMEKWEEQTEAELIEFMSYASTHQLQHLHDQNMGKNPEYIHPITELIGEELFRRKQLDLFSVA